MTESWSAWPAPAKLNLFLHIVGLREDGYHLLQTVFQLLDWGDTIRLRARNDGAISRLAGPAQIAPENDLTVRAALALRAATGCVQGVDIVVDKQIPTGGGLGGGSSNAATVLLALNEIWATRLDVGALAEIGLGLGADVSLFVRGRSAWAEGVGEQLTPIELPPRHFVIVDPGVAVSTADLFQAPELTRNSPRMTIGDFVAGTVTANAFTPPVRARYPQVAAALDWLGEYGNARLSGSGGCGFVAVASAQQAQEIVRICPPPFRAYSTHSVDRSPLHAALDSFRSRQ